MRTITRLATTWMFLGGAAAAAAQQPVTLTSTADFRRGNNEGLISPAQDRVTRDRISAGAVGAWSSSTALPEGRNLPCTVTYNGFLYVLGGFEPGTNYASSVVRVAPINGDGSVGDWSATTPLPGGHNLFSAAAYNSFLYVMGGMDSDYIAYSDVLVASIHADGTLGAWSSTTALPDTRGYHASVVHNGFLYVLGGVEAGGYTGSVLTAQLQADGSVGAWSSTTSLPSSLIYHSAFAFNNFLYVMGGFTPDSGAVRSDVWVATLNSDGSVGAWSSSTALPNPRVMHSAVADGGFVYVLGGFDESFSLTDDVFVAPLNSDGAVGTWQSTTALPSARGRHRSVAVEGFMYVFAGTDAGYNFFTDVLVAPIAADVLNANQTAGRLRGFYSHLVDKQADSSSTWIVLNGQLSPGGAISLQVRTAPDASGLFGAETVVSATLGTPIEVPGTARYVWIRLTLDDTGTSNVDQPTYVSDITVSGLLPPSPGVVLDGPDADIDSQSSTSMIEANWSGFTPFATDSIAHYEWAIGTAPGSINVQGWANVGMATSASNSSLALTTGMKFVSVRAVSASGLTSAAATSDGVQVLPAQGDSGGGGGGHKGRCGQSASASPGSALAILAGLAVLAYRRRR